MGRNRKTIIDLYTEMRVICGHLRNNDELDTVTSGGLVTALSRKIVSRGGVVFGVTYTADFKAAKYIKVECINDVESLKGTKYIRADKQLSSGNELKMEIEDNLKNGRIVLCIGLPCDIVSVNRYLQSRKVNIEHYYSVDLICHGPARNDMHKSFVELLESRYHSRIVSYNVRYKNPNWKPAYVRAEFEDGQVYMEKLSDCEFGKAFNVCPQLCSYTCKFKNDNRCSDITAGDFWGISEKDSIYNSKGVSVGIIHTDRSEWLLEMDGFDIASADVNTALIHNPRYSSPLSKNPDADRFLKQYEVKGLEYACRHYMGIKTHIKRKVKAILRYCKQIFGTIMD